MKLKLIRMGKMWPLQASPGNDWLHSLGVFTHNGESFKNDSFSARIAVERKPKFIQRSLDRSHLIIFTCILRNINVKLLLLLTESIGSVLYSLLIYLLPTFNGIVKTH